MSKTPAHPKNVRCTCWRRLGWIEDPRAAEKDLQLLVTTFESEWPIDPKLWKGYSRSLREVQKKLESVDNPPLGAHPLLRRLDIALSYAALARAGGPRRGAKKAARLDVAKAWGLSIKNDVQAVKDVWTDCRGWAESKLDEILGLFLNQQRPGSRYPAASWNIGDLLNSVHLDLLDFDKTVRGSKGRKVQHGSKGRRK